jgi:transketolase
MLHEALLASEILHERGFGLKVVNLPWLNRIDAGWLAETIGDCSSLFVLEDHAPVGGLGDRLLDALVSHRLLGARSFEKFAVEGYPACGTPTEALQHHRLNGQSLAERIAS